MSLLRLLCRVAAGVLFPALARAHSDGANPWMNWPFEPEILALTLMVAGLYIAGWIRHQPRAAVVTWKHLSFFAGLIALLIALQSPLDAAADHSFAMHQIQHLLLGAIGPILLMLATPHTLLIAGMPRAVRNWILAPILTSSTIRLIFGFFAHPVLATFIGIAVLMFWHVPQFHDLAVLDEGVHYAMHWTFLLSGLFFFWRMLDPRPPPVGASYSARIVMSLASIAASAPLGAYFALKSSVLYTAYDIKGRLEGLEALQDEALGGLIMWVPGGVILAVPMLIVIRFWAAREDRLDALRRRGITSPPSAVSSDVRNRRLGWRLGLIALASGACAVGVGYLQQFLP